MTNSAFNVSKRKIIKSFESFACTPWNNEFSSPIVFLNSSGLYEPVVELSQNKPINTWQYSNVNLHILGLILKVIL